jgi:hypothetical protein
VNPGTEILESLGTVNEKDAKGAWMRMCTDSRSLMAWPHCGEAVSQALIARQFGVNHYTHIY